ncbi:MAG: class I adenylate-forming enzyme family protein [Firmicutes bacterium]|nr:class I adenylate-forming enzyme family protein [Bacillota bacterium]
MLTVGAALTSAARRMGSKDALIFGQERLSFRELERQANQFARALQSVGIGRGDRVGLLLPNGLEMARAYFGIAKAGAVGVPLNLRWAAPEIAYALVDAGVSLLLADPEFRPLISQLDVVDIPVFFSGEGGDWTRLYEAQEPSALLEVAVKETDPWVLVYTSGTTGRPKGAVRNHIGNLMIALTLVSEMGIHSEQTGFAILPMFHVNSMWFVTLSVAIGATCVIYPQRAFHPRHIIEQMNEHRVNYSMFVPSLLTFLADAVEAGVVLPDALEVIMTSSAPLSGSIRDRILKGFPRSRLYDIYGATEYGAATILRHRLGGALGSVGYPTMGLDLLILDERRQPVPDGTVGEVFAKGMSVISEYWKRPEVNLENFTPDGYLTVGDLGYQNGDGMLCLVDRKQDMIVVAGENVYPTEVEDVLLRSSSVALAAVFGVPDERRGERVVAAVVAKQNETVQGDELTDLCRRFLADYKRPHRIEVVAELPLGPAGKVVRRLAREQFLAAWSNPEPRPEP